MVVGYRKPGEEANRSNDREVRAERLAADTFRANGWKILERSGQQGPDLLVERSGKKYVVQCKWASEGRRDRVISLLSQAVLEAAYFSRSLRERPCPVAIVAANRIPESVAEQAKQFAGKRAAHVAVGLLDLDGLRSFAGHGLESLSAKRGLEQSIPSSKLRSRAPQLFSDLNQWMLKVLLAPGIPESYLSSPRSQYRGAAQLAKAARVSVMSAFRFVQQFSEAGFLDQDARRLRLVRTDELARRWGAAAQQRLLEIPMRWVVNKGKDALPSALRSYIAAGAMRASQARRSEPAFPSERLRACLGLFAAAEALRIGFVHGVESHLYLDRISERALNKLGLSANGAEQRPDVYVRIPVNRECVFRGVVVKEGVPSSDIVQVWLDVAGHPSRGREQADIIYKRILASAFAAQGQ
jgi:hypothetical protein